MRICVVVVAALLWMTGTASAVKGQTVRSSPDIPVTRFTCSGKPPGYYADLDTGCQVYHMCTEGGNQFSYQCPNTTLFQQRMLICAHWYQVNCSRSEQHYGANLLIGQRDKPFVNDDSREKIVKTLQNPDLLQHLSDGINRHPKEHVNSDSLYVNRVLPNNLNKDGENQNGVLGKTTSILFNKRPFERQSSPPLAGTVLPGGIKNMHFPNDPDQNVYLRNQFKNIPQYPSTKVQILNNRESQQKNENHVVRNSTMESIETSNLIYKNTSSVSATNQTIESKSGEQEGSLNLKIGVRLNSPQGKEQTNDLDVASHVNAVTSSKSSTEASNLPSWNGITETGEKGFVKQALKGNFPIDEYNTFINRFDPYSEPETTKVITTSEVPLAEPHVFINRYNPNDGEISADNLTEEPHIEYMFINRFVLTPEEMSINQDNLKVDQLHNLLPPNDHAFVNSPSLEFTPPIDDTNDSEDHVIELHFQDPRQNVFIPIDGTDSSKDVAPIVVTIPITKDNKTTHMWFRSNDSKDKCTRCHPWFVVDKAKCSPCVIIR